MASKKAKPSKNRTNKSKPLKFEDHWSQDQVQTGLRNGLLIEGHIRVNPKNFEESFVLHPKGDADILLDGLAARNRALSDDFVAVIIEPIREWKVVQSTSLLAENGDKVTTRASVGSYVNGNLNAIAELFPDATSTVDLESNKDPPGCTQLFRRVIRTGRVVAIIRAMHHRVAVGTVRPMASPESNPMKRMLFCPEDRRVPRMILERNDYPPNILSRTEEFSKSFFMAQLIDWEVDSIYGKGRILRLLGEPGELDVERTSILISHGIEYSEFSPEVLACLPNITELDPSEVARRRDFRDQCVFTIDPSTARDLDDALHVCEVEPGRVYEVGVHIADVSHYVHENSALDDAARSRATSVYLIDQVIPMLPRRLCEELCSLNPREGKLTFSVVWHMDCDGNVLDTWFGRSVIQSCVKLSYDLAQAFIEQPSRTEWSVEELPPISAPWTPQKIANSVLILADLAKAMRQHRFENGALLLNTPKLGFILDTDNGMPCGIRREELKASNFLVEEFMLLANISVARKISHSLPDEAFLRRHPPPSERALEEVENVFQSLGLSVATGSAGEIHDSLQHIMCTKGKDQIQVLVNLLSKPMQLARYFCGGQLARCDSAAGSSFTHHYALNVELYTHFTSPIRRYADVIVHRQLSAALEGRETSLVEKQEGDGRGFTPSLDSVAEWCNWRKKNAKLAGEASRDLFLRIFITSVGSLDDDAIVLGVLDRSFDVLLLQLGTIKRVYCEQIKSLQNMKFEPLVNVRGAGRIVLRFDDNTTQTVLPMSKVKVTLQADKKANNMKYDVLLVPTPDITG